MACSIVVLLVACTLPPALVAAEEAVCQTEECSAAGVSYLAHKHKVSKKGAVLTAHSQTDSHNSLQAHDSAMQDIPEGAARKISDPVDDASSSKSKDMSLSQVSFENNDEARTDDAIQDIWSSRCTNCPINVHNQAKHEVGCKEACEHYGYVYVGHYGESGRQGCGLRWSVLSPNQAHWTYPQNHPGCRAKCNCAPKPAPKPAPTPAPTPPPTPEANLCDSSWLEDTPVPFRMPDASHGGCYQGQCNTGGQCAHCPIGRFSNEVNSAACLDCPAGKSSQTAGSTECY